ncbi:MAG: fructose-specific PTS transporter subunit EIIC [Megasphaera sp.]|jgi:PTS system fructose-specific IIC component|nr:fructose-specific PTS transporter subunit EIIC [Megasphaera sp.]
MRIVDLLKNQSIDLHATATDKKSAIDHMVDLMAANGNLIDKGTYKKCVFDREQEGSTGIGEGIAIPHAKTAAVREPGLAAMISRDGIDFDSIDDEPAHLFFLIAAPEGGENIHLELLSRLSRMLMDNQFRDSLMESKSTDDFLTIIDNAETKQRISESSDTDISTPLSPSSRPFVVAVTACPTGIAHTYMAAESLETKAKAMEIDIKVETDGSGGTKNILTTEDIEKAVGVIVAADKNVETQRFSGKPVLFVNVARGIKEPEVLIKQILSGQVPVFRENMENKAEIAANKRNEGVGRQIYKHVMNGVSHMLPFVIGGGIMIALAFLFDMQHAGTAQFGSGTPLAAFLKNIGGLSFGMMMPILAGYIAMSIGERPALMPGIVGGFLATTGGSGFFGALFAGFIGGFLILGLTRLFSNLPKALEGTKPVLLFPVIGLILIGIVMTYIINPPTALFNAWLADTLNGMSTSSRIILGLALGGMMSIDFGGPINKAAYVFGTASLMSASGTAVSSGIMASVMVGGMVPPIAIALCTLFFKRKFTVKERQSCITTFIMGASFITEGAIPFAASDPLHIIPSCAIGSAAAGALSMLFNCTLPAPHGGIFVFGVVTNWPMYLVSLLIGSIVAMLILGVIKKDALQE